MTTILPYGTNHINLDLPDDNDITVIEPVYVPPLSDAEAALRTALNSPIGTPPLKDMVKPGERVGIIFNDITRATPNCLLIHALVDSLPHIPAKDITLFNALGTHRENTPAELLALLDEELVSKYEIVQNNPFDRSTQVHIGKTSRGTEAWINHRLYECELKILTGFIEPHLFAGFSGGGKAVMPGMAGMDTILANHSAPMIGNPNATWGNTYGNPIWEDVREVALLAGRVFLLNVTQNRDQKVTGIYCGSLPEAHDRGCADAKRTAMVNVTEPFDIVITSNSGYPLDQNLYQSVKGMSAAAQIVRPGGSIIIASACADGIPDHGLYRSIISSHQTPADVLMDVNNSTTPRHDQWEAQLQAMIQVKADVYVYSDGLTDHQLRQMMLKRCPDISATVAQLLLKYGPRARICVLPEGPQTIPCLV
jgi:nickel-dependent lactate racemase